jgi:glycosyltransferase involved in cell wall biosynthesis
MTSRSESAPTHVEVQALVLHPDLERVGGIEGYYRKIFPHFRIAVESFEIGRRHDERGGLTGRFSGLLRPLSDYVRLRRRLRRGDVSVVIFNPSLKLNTVVREGLMQRLAKARGRRTIVFWRGWEPALAKRIDANGGWFRWLYGRTDAFVVLANEFRDSLERWGMQQPIHSEVTVIDDVQLAQIDCAALIERRLATRPRKVLFLARLLRPKGIHEMLAAIVRMNRETADAAVCDTRAEIRLVVAGDGPELEPARRFAAEQQLANVDFLGQVSGDAKLHLLKEASVLCLPSKHGEGMPNSVVEAMAFGLPIVTTRVGGIADFFRDGVHGYAVAGADPAGIATALRKLLESSAAARIEAIYRTLQNSPKGCP